MNMKIKDYKTPQDGFNFLLHLAGALILISLSGFSNGVTTLTLLIVNAFAMTGYIFSLHPVSAVVAKNIFRVTGICGALIIVYDGYVRMTTGFHSPGAVVGIAITFVLFDYYLDEMKRIQREQQV